MALVFVPPIGFRPGGTRTLRERVATTVDATELTVVALAAAPSRTDVIVEWNRTGDPAVCPPQSRILAHSNRTPLENGLAAEIVISTGTLRAIAATRRSYHASHSTIGAVDAISFPSLPPDVNGCELHLREGANSWRVPFSVARGGAHATPLAAAATSAGVVVRATALSRYDSQLIVALEVQAATQIRQVGAPVPGQAHNLAVSEEDRRARTAEMQRHFGAQAAPIALVDDRGARHEEVGRLFWQEPQQAAPGGAFTSRFSVMFDAPGTEVKHATLVILFVELNDFAPSTTVDLRTAPVDVELGGHHFRVVAVEPYGDDQRRIVLELPVSGATPRFVQPARVHGADPEFGWQRHAFDANAPGRLAIWMATKVGDPPIVTFTGVVLRLDGPLQLDLPLG